MRPVKLRDLPPVYARLAGFVAGSLLRGPLDGAVRHLPEPVQRGWELARLEGRQEPRVLLVPGFLGPSPLLIPLALFLRLHGRRVELLHNFPAFDGVVPLAERIARHVARMQDATGDAQVDLVCHSMGGLAARYYARHLDGARQLRRLITIATPHRGTRWAWWPLNQSMRDMKPESPLIAALENERPIAGVRCLNIRASWDQIVWPAEMSRWGWHADELVLPFSEHWAIQLDPRTLALVLTLLEATDSEVQTVDIAGLEGGERV
ncbi:MAG TPA: alpha/beta fold hydrolase [Oscillatoriaceae cyanobacterium]